MITTLLIDLDNTLLKNSMAQFLPAYLSRMASHLAQIAPPDRLIQELMHSTQHMKMNEDPACTLEEVFLAHFFPAIGTTAEALEPYIADFYSREFPGLASLADPLPQAKSLMEAAFDKGLEVVIATDPLFPLTAVEQRLVWAGIPADEFPYAMVASYDRLHFSKPHLAYYAQILGMLGRSPTEAAMVGNDPQADLAPARALGMPAYQIDLYPGSPTDGGTLGEVLDWLEHAALREASQEAASSPTATIARLKGDLAALMEMTKKLESQSWSHAHAQEEWSPLEIVCHLRDLEIEVNLPRFQAIISQDNPFIPHADADRWAKERDYRSQSPDQALSAFIQARKQTCEELEELDPKAWKRTGRHSLLGPTTLAEITAMIAQHDQIHLAQLRTTLADIPNR